MILRLFFVLLVVMSGLQDSHAMDRGEEGLPQGYQHAPLRKQIQRYFDVFDPLMQEFPQTFNEASVPDLFPILKNGFAYLHDYIVKDEKRTENHKNAYIDLLRAMWGQAQSTDLTPHHFNVYMRYLVAYASYFKTNKEGPQSAVELERLKRALNNPRACVYLRPAFTLFLTPNPEVKKRSISPHTEVYTFLGHTYGAYLLSFDLLLSENVTYSDTYNPDLIEEGLPHDGRFNGTLDMYDHDEGHAERTDRDVNENVYALLKKIYTISQMYEEKKLTRNTSILEGSLHLFFHEVLPYATGQEGYYAEDTKESLLSKGDLLHLDKFTAAPIGKECFSNFTQAISHYMTSELFRKFPMGSRYNSTPLDWEFVLKTNKDENGSLLLTPENRNEDTIKAGYKRFWSDFETLVLEKWDDIP